MIIETDLHFDIPTSNPCSYDPIVSVFSSDGSCLPSLGLVLIRCRSYPPFVVVQRPVRWLLDSFSASKAAGT
jgi:hypothetical protein